MSEETRSSLLTGPTGDCGETGRVLVLGLGNILLKDEGVGVHVAAKLQEMALGPNVEVIDGGTAGLDVLLGQRDLYKLVVIDAMKAGGKSGTIYKAELKADERNKLTQIFGRQQSKISLHQVGLIEALSAAEKMGAAPERIVIIGVEPGEIDCGLELTEPVEQKVPEVVEKVLEVIENDIHRE